MYKFFGLVMLSALAAVSGNRKSINEPLDLIIEKFNDHLRKTGTTSSPVPEISFASEVKYSGAVFYGIDSIKRTADSWMEMKEDNITVDISYGFGLMAIGLHHLEVGGKNMSAYVRVRDNSVKISFTAYKVAQKCHIKLNELQVEKLGDVEFAASIAEYDGSNLDGFFEDVVTPTLNEIVDTHFAEIEVSSQALCKIRDFQNAAHVEEVLMSLL